MANFSDYTTVDLSSYKNIHLPVTIKPYLERNSLIGIDNKMIYRINSFEISYNPWVVILNESEL